MALPLLMMAGAGILGGSQFLLKKSDDREAASMLEDFVPSIPGLMGNQLNAEFQSAAQKIMSEEFGFLDAGRADRARSLLEDYGVARKTVVDSMAAQEQAYQQNRNTAITDLRQIEAKSAQRYAQVQTALRGVEDLIGNRAQISTQDLYAAVFRMAEALAPGDRKTNEDIQNIINTNPAMLRLQNLVRGEATGSVDAQLAENLYATLYRLAGTEEQLYNNVQKDFRNAEAAYYQRGWLSGEDQPLYDLGYGVDVNYTPRLPGSNSGLTPQQQKALEASGAVVID